MTCAQCGQTSTFDKTWYVARRLTTTPHETIAEAGEIIATDVVSLCSAKCLEHWARARANQEREPHSQLATIARRGSAVVG